MDVDEPSAPSQTSAPAGVAGIGALVALQQVEDATTGRSRGLKRAEAMLGELDEMHKALIFGGLPTARLQAMANQMKQRLECGNDSHLHSIMADIELRLAVELAKRGIGLGCQAIGCLGRRQAAVRVGQSAADRVARDCLRQ